MIETICDWSAVIAFVLTLLLLFAPILITASVEKGRKVYDIVSTVLFYAVFLDCLSFGTFLLTLLLK